MSEVTLCPSCGGVRGSGPIWMSPVPPPCRCPEERFVANTCGPIEVTMPGEAEASAKLALLRAAVRLYLEKPGCNVNSRATAMVRLRHALEQS